MKHIKQKHKIHATPEEVYAALTNPVTIELWTGYPALMSQEPDTEFSLWEGDIVGRNICFIKNELVQQEWYFGDQEEQSIVTIRLTADKDSTLVNLVHENVPDEEYDDLNYGWKNYYWGAIKKFYK